jgi:hypothetical protein
MLSAMEPNKSQSDDSGPSRQASFIISGQPTGWAAMAETMRAYDEDKVKDVKEDMDGLFIFVRLCIFSGD